MLSQAWRLKQIGLTIPIVTLFFNVSESFCVQLGKKSLDIETVQAEVQLSLESTYLHSDHVLNSWKELEILHRCL